MHHKKHETRHQSTTSTSSHHYRLATRSSTLKSNKVKRLIKSSITKHGISRRLSLYSHSLFPRLEKGTFSWVIITASMLIIQGVCLIVRLYVNDNLLINSDDIPFQSD